MKRTFCSRLYFGSSKSQNPSSSIVRDGVRLRRVKAFWSQPKTASQHPCAGVARSFYIDVRVAHHQRFLRRSGCFRHQREQTLRSWLFGRETVSAINAEEILGNSQTFANGLSRADRFVRQDRHWPAATVRHGLESLQRIENPRIQTSVV